MMKTLAWMIILVISYDLFAMEIGVGGDAVVCRTARGKIITAEILDYYEGRVNRGIPHVFESQISHQDFFKRIEPILKELDENSFSRIISTDHFLKSALILEQEISSYRKNGYSSNKDFVFTDERLADFPDYENVGPRKGCEVEQVLLKTKAYLPNDPTYMVQAELIKALNEDNIRGLIMNHALTRAFYQNVKDSTDARFVHQKLTSVPLSEVNFKFLSRFAGKFIKKLKGYDLSKIKELSTGEILYDESYVLTNEGAIDREKTWQRGVARMFINFSAGTKNGIGAPIIPEGSFLSVKYEDGRVENFEIARFLNLHNLTFRAGERIEIAVRIERKRAFSQLDSVSLNTEEEYLFYNMKVGSRGFSFVKKYEVVLNDKTKWSLKEIN